MSKQPKNYLKTTSKLPKKTSPKLLEKLQPPLFIRNVQKKVQKTYPKTVGFGSNPPPPLLVNVQN